MSDRRERGPQERLPNAVLDALDRYMLWLGIPSGTPAQRMLGEIHLRDSLPGPNRPRSRSASSDQLEHLRRIAPSGGTARGEKLRAEQAPRNARIEADFIQVALDHPHWSHSQVAQYVGEKYKLGGHQIMIIVPPSKRPPRAAQIQADFIEVADAHPHWSHSQVADEVAEKHRVSPDWVLKIVPESMRP